MLNCCYKILIFGVWRKRAVECDGRYFAINTGRAVEANHTGTGG